MRMSCNAMCKVILGMMLLGGMIAQQCHNCDCSCVHAVTTAAKSKFKSMHNSSTGGLSPVAFPRSFSLASCYPPALVLGRTPDSQHVDLTQLIPVQNRLAADEISFFTITQR